jgi:hypothetical protein
MVECSDNLNCVLVINKPCMRGARYVRLIPWTLQSGSEQEGTRRLRAARRSDKRRHARQHVKREEVCLEVLWVPRAPVVDRHTMTPQSRYNAL